MKIIRVFGKNFKGQDFDYELAPVTIITGSNFSGKTAVPMALRLCLSESLPAPIGVKGIYRLAGNPDEAGEMEVGIGTDDGRNVALKWIRDVKGKITKEGGLPSDLRLPPLLVEPKQFFAMTGQERVQTIFQSCPGAGKDLTGNIGKRLTEIQVIPVAVRQAVIGEVGGWMADAFTKSSLPPQQAASRLLDFVKLEVKTAADKVKLVTAQVQGFRLPPGKPADVSAELEKARQELAKLAVNDDLDRKNIDINLNNIGTKLAAYCRKYQNLPVEQLAPFLEAELLTVASDLRKLAPAPPLDEIEEQIEEADEADTNAQRELFELAERGELLLATKVDLEIAGCCPTCGAKGNTWKTAKVAELEKEMNEIRANLAQIKNQVSKTELTLTTFQSQKASILKAQSDYAQTKSELDTAAEAFTTDRDNITALLTERSRLQASLSDVQAQTDPEVVKMLQTRVAALQQQQDTIASYDRDFAKLSSLETELMQSQSRADVLKAVIKIVAEEQAKASEAAFSKVLGTARAFTDGMLNSPLEFMDGDLGRRVSALDRQRAGFTAKLGSWITHEGFSDSEQRIAYSAFSVAIANGSPIRIVIIDELATLQADKKVLFVDRLIQLQRKGIIDQAICLEPGGADYDDFRDESGVKMLAL